MIKIYSDPRQDRQTHTAGNTRPLKTSNQEKKEVHMYISASNHGNKGDTSAAGNTRTSALVTMATIKWNTSAAVTHVHHP